MASIVDIHRFNSFEEALAKLDLQDILPGHNRGS